MAGPLTGVKVIDLSRAIAGPYCAMMLGDMGAEVVKVEMPGRGDEARSWGPPFLDGESVYSLLLNRNKRSITLNLRHPAGQEVLRRLLREAAVLVENFSPGTIDRLGFGYSQVQELNPAIVFCSISGFGQSGPGYDKPAYDPILQAMGGLMSVTGPPGGPPYRVGVAVSDVITGMLAAYAIVCALFHRRETGQGQYVDTSLLDGQVALLTHQAGLYLLGGQVPGPLGNRHAIVAPSDAYRSRDGYVMVTIGNDDLWRRFCQAMELEHLADDARFRHNPDRIAHVDEMTALIGQRVGELTRAEVQQRLEVAQVPCGPIRSVQEVFEDPQVGYLGLRQRVHHSRAGEVEITGLPYRLSQTPPAIHRPPPALGEHTSEVLTELGLSPEEIQTLRRDGAV